MKELDRNTAFFKTLILISKPDLVRLRSVIHSDPAVKIGSTDEMSINEAFVSEITTFTKVSKAEVEEATKECESDPISKRLNAVIKHVQEKKDVKAEEEKKPQKSKKVEETKGEIEKLDAVGGDQEIPDVDSIDEDHHKMNVLKVEDDPLLLYGLDNNAFLASKINELASFADNNYNPPAAAAAPSEINLFTKVYNIDPDTVLVEYIKTLTDLYKELCRKTISSFFQGLSIENLFDFIFKNNENTQRFLSYVLMKGNEAAESLVKNKNSVLYDAFISFIENMIKS